MSDGALVTLTITFNSEEAGFANSLGWYNARTGEAGILFLDLNDDGKHAAIEVGDTRSLTVSQSDLDAGNIGFFLIPDGADEYSDSLLSSPMQFAVGPNGDGRIIIDQPHGSDVILKGTNGDVLFSDQEYNKGDYDYVSGTVGTDGQTKAEKLGEQSDGADGILGIMAWDDQLVKSGNKGSDRDFNDAVFNVSVAPPANSAPSTPVDVDSNDDFVLETAAVGDMVGIIASSVDPDLGDSVTYSLSDDAGGLFAIDAVTGLVTVAGKLDYETTIGHQYTIKVQATDNTGEHSEAEFVIKVGDVQMFGVDGYLAGATVFADADGDGIRGASEAFTTTDPFGAFDLNSGGAPLVMVGGIDIATGLPFHGRLTAPAGSTVITPLTTLLYELEVLGAPDPATMLASYLGLPDVPDFTTLDPIAAATAPGGSIDAFAASSQVLNTVTMIGNLIAGASPGFSQEQAVDLVVEDLAYYMSLGIPIVLTDPTSVEFLIGASAARIGAPVDAVAAAAAAVVAASNSFVENVTGVTPEELLTGITAASIVAQGDASDALNEAGASGDPDGLETVFVDGLSGLVGDAVNQVGNVTGTGTEGSENDDPLDLTDNNDTFDALGGNDEIDGKGGRDIILGSAGDDTLSGGSGNDQLYGGIGNDTLNGDDDDDRLTGGAGNDALDGGAGADTYLHSGTAADGDDTVNNGDGVDKVVFTTADLYDLTYERQGDDLIVGAYLAGNEVYDGSVRVAGHYAGSAIAYVEIDVQYNTVYGTDPDVSRFYFTTDLANGLANVDATEILMGTGAGETINTNGGYYDAAYGAGGDDTIQGGDFGRENLRGGDGNDIILGGGGDDLLRGDDGDDLLDGGAGRDTARYSFGSINGGVSADLAAGQGQGLPGGATNVGIDTFVDIENLTGSKFDDELYGNAGKNRLNGYFGDDILEGRGGNDELIGESGTDEYRHSGTVDDGDDTVSTGDDGIDYVVFTTPDLYDLDYFRDGNDLVIGAYRNDGPMEGSLRIIDHYAGSSIAYVSIDTEFYNEFYGENKDAAKLVFTTLLDSGLNQAGYTEVLLGSEDGETINGNGGFYDSIYGNGGDDTITTGDDGPANVRGGTGNDTIVGGAGNDRIRGDEGDDYLDGGLGTDTVRYDRGNVTGGVVVDLSGYAQDRDGIDDNIGFDLLASFENVRGSKFDDLLIGDGTSNTIEGRDGNDELFGAGGFDSLFGEDGNDTINGEDGEADFLDGGVGDDWIVTDGQTDAITGGAGKDVFVLTSYALDPGLISTIADFELGADRIDLSMLLGGFVNGSDPALFVAATFDATDTILSVDSSGGGSAFNDVVRLANVNVTLQDLLDAGALNMIPSQGTPDSESVALTEYGDIFNGGDGDDMIDALGGNDLLAGGGGYDTIYGGAGADTYQHSGTIADGNDVIYTGDNGVDVVVLTASNLYDINFWRDGKDLIVGGFDPNVPDSGTLRIVDHYNGASIAYMQIDTELYNLLYGTNPDFAKIQFTTDISSGQDLADMAEFLLGTEGDDVINTGGGYYDAVYAAGGNDEVNGSDAEDHFRGQDGNDTLNGGGGNDRLRGDQGDDLLDGGGGVDRARYDTAQGAVEVDLEGFYAKDRDINGNSGFDTLVDIEDVRGSSFADLISGDSADNKLEGRSGNDVLEGRGGHDALLGQGGDDVLLAEDGKSDDLDGGDGDDKLVTDAEADTLTGGTGKDLFVFTGFPSGATALSFIMDFDLGADRIDVSFLLNNFDLQTSDPAQFVRLIAGTDDLGDYTLVQVDVDGTGSAFQDLVRLDGVRYELNDLLAFGALLMAPEVGSPGADNVTLSEQGDIFDGAGGEDTIFALGGDDLITGGADNDTVDLGSGADTYFHAGTLTDGDDTINTGDDGVDKVVFTTADLYDFDYDRDGDDLIVGIYNPVTDDYDGKVRVVNHYAGSSVAVVEADFALYNLFYGADADVSSFYFTTDLANGLENTTASEILLGSNSEIFGDTIIANGGYYDSIFGHGGDDYIDGGEGFDNIRGGEGIDIILGGGGDDAIRGDQGDDYLDGGDGTGDKIRYDRGLVTSGVYVNLELGIGQDLYGDADAVNVGIDTLVGFENIYGSKFDDELHGDGGDNFIRGDLGDDLIYGGGGVDTVIGQVGNDTIIAEGAGGFYSGDEGEDIILDGTGGNGLDGGAGDDLISFGFLSSFANGGSGRDVFLFHSADVDQFSFIGDFELGPNGDILDLSAVGAIDPNFIDQYLQVSDYYNDLFLFFDPSGTGTAFTPVAYLSNMAGVTFDQLIDGGNLVYGPTSSNFGESTDNVTAIDDAGGTYYAMAGNDSVTGGAGDDLIRGGGGEDTLAGGAGNDALEGGADSDMFVFALANAGDDVVRDFDRSSDKLSFTDVVDDGDSDLDLDDLLAMVSSVVDDGLNVLVTYTTGASTQFQGVGNGAIASLSDLVDDAANQISVV